MKYKAFILCKKLCKLFITFVTLLFFYGYCQLLHYDRREQIAKNWGKNAVIFRGGLHEKGSPRESFLLPLFFYAKVGIDVLYRGDAFKDLQHFLVTDTDATAKFIEVIAVCPIPGAASGILIIVDG